MNSTGRRSFRGVSLEMYRKQAEALLNGLGFEIDQPEIKNDPLKFLHVAQNTHHNSAEQDTSLEPDERRYAQYIIPYLQENSSKRSRTPESLAREVVKELRQPRASRCSYMIFGSAGTGKSVYLTTLFAFIKERLVRSQREEPDFPHIPVLHSNLKESKSLSSITFSQRVVLDGIRLDDCFPTHDVQHLEQLSSLLRLGQGQFKKGIILIDALDEYLSTNYRTKIDSVREQLTQVNRELQDAGFIPIWSCRTREFKRLRLDDLFREGDQSELGRVRRYNIPYLDTRNLSNVCMLDENAWPKPEVQNPPSKILKLLKTVEDKDRPPKRTSRLDRDFIEWLGRATMMNPLFFYFRIFSPPQVSHRLTHQLIERMYDVFQNEKSGELIDAGNFVEKQNNFVISDLLITTLVRYLISTYNKDYRIQESFTHLIRVYQSEIPQNPEDVSTILPKLFADEVPLKENITYEILETFGIFHTIGEKVEKTKFRHRSFAEFFGICDALGASTDLQKCIKKAAEDRQSIWGWRRYDEHELEQLKDPMYQRTGGFALSVGPGRFDGLGAYLECMKSINQNIDKTFESIGTEDIRANKQSQRFSEEQSHSLKRGLSNKQPIILKGWPGTGKTFTGTHFLISRLVNQFIKSTKTLYLPENEPKGLIVTLNPKLSRFLKSPQELNVYRKGPWNLLLPSDSSSLTVEWGYLRQSIEVYSMEEIIRKLDGGQGSAGLKIIDLKYIQSRLWKNIYIENGYHQRPNHQSYSWKEAASDLQERFYDEYGVFREQYNPLNDAFDEARKTWHSVVKTILGAQSNTHTIQSACLKLIHRYIQSFDVYNLAEVDFSTRLSDSDERTEQELRHDFQSNPYLERFSVALVDEVQDLPVAACVLISMIVTREENVTADHVMFAGDENQVINQSDFRWKSFFTGHKRLIDELSRCYKDDLNYNSYLVSPAAKALGDERIDNFVHNYRNLPSIVKTWKRAGSWKPETSMLPDLEGIEECVSMVNSAADSGAVKFVYIKASENKTGKVSAAKQTEAVEEVIKFVSREGISVISMSDIVDRFKERKDVIKMVVYSDRVVHTEHHQRSRKGCGHFAGYACTQPASL